MGRFAIVWSLSLPSGLAETTVLYAHRMLDVVKGEMLSKAVLVIEGDRIVSLNPEESSCRREAVELDDVTLLPGLIDTHTHLTSNREGDWVHRSVKQGPPDRALAGVRGAWRTLMAGFTTVRDLGTRGFADVALMGAIDSGMLAGPRIIPSGHPLGITGGHCDITGYRPGLLELGPKEGVADGVDQVVQAVRYQIKHGAKVIKTCATAGVFSFEGSVGAQQYSNEELGAMGRRGRPARSQGGSPRPRNRGNSGGCAGRCGVHRAWLDPDRRSHPTHEVQRDLSCTHRVSG